jgi:hypothetical protein
MLVVLIYALVRNSDDATNALSDLTRDTPLHSLFPDADPLRPDAVENPPFTSLSYGVQAFLWWNDGWSAGKHMDWVLMMQFTHVKQSFPWRLLEPEPGVWVWDQADFIINELEKRDLRIVARLDQTPAWALPDDLADREGFIDAPAEDLRNWQNYCGTLAERYQGRIKAYQIWNEPNLTREWGSQPPDAARYVELLRVCSEAIRAADPEAIIISAGLAPTGNLDALAMRDDIYLQQLYDHGFERYIDVVGVHAPGYSAPSYGTDDAERDGRQRWQSFRRVEDLRRIMVENGDAARQMAILEFGYTTDTQNPVYSWFAVTPEQQAEYIVDAYRYAAENWRPWVGLMSLIYIANPVWTEENEEFWWALDNPVTFETRPAFAAVIQMEKYCGDIVLPARSPEETGGVPDEPNPCS